MTRRDEGSPRTGLAGFVAREALSYALNGALLPVAGGRVHAPDGDGPLVLFVHGHMSGPGAFAFLQRALQKAGYRRFAAYGYKTGLQRLDRIAGGLAEFAAGFEGELLIVAHSVGGLVARLWLQDLGGAERTGALATLATPHLGVPLARYAQPVPFLADLAPGSELLKRLWGGAHRLEGVACTSILSGRDHFVPVDQGHFHPAPTHVIDAVGHVGLLFSPEAHSLISRALLDAAPPADTRAA